MSHSFVLYTFTDPESTQNIIDYMYETYNIRPELLKSRQFYNNAFDTSVNYEDLMALKKELMR